MSINDSMSVWVIPRITKTLDIIVFLKAENGITDKNLPVSKAEPMIKVHGNVLYNFSYRSYLDTPFAQTGLMQHQVLSTLNVTLKNKYPLQVQVGMRNSNSPYFKNSLDVNVTYNHRQLMDNIKEDLRKKIISMAGDGSVSEVGNKYRQHVQQARELQAWINSPARSQEIIEEKERSITSLKDETKVPSLINENLKAGEFTELGNAGAQLKQSLEEKNAVGNLWSTLQQKMIDSLKGKVSDYFQNRQANASIKEEENSIVKKVNEKIEELKKLEDRIKTEESKIRELKKSALDSLNSLKREINSLNSTASLYDFMNKKGISKDSLTKAQKLLLSVTQVGIGRIFLDYSELTVKNMSLTGVNLEANPGKFYFAAAAGKVNYRFRDFILKSNHRLPPQSLLILRGGMGNKERNNLIFSFYNGQKNELIYSPGGPGRTSNKVLGISAEARWALDANNYVIAEIAKSSYNPTGTRPPNSNLLNKTFDLKTHTNEAYSLRLFSQYPATHTRFTAYYRKMGENFQSFNLYPSHVNEEAWMVKLNQSFLKRKLTLEAAIRKNNFESPLATPSSYSAKTIFKSVQATLRVRKYPFVSIGYYPTSQLSFANNNMLVENQYNTLNTVVSHSYQLKKIPMNTTAVFTQFFNNSTDTGFIYFNAKNFSLNHSVFISAFTSQSGLSLTEQKNIHLVTMEQTIGYRLKNNFSLSAGLKWNRLNRIQNLWGGTAGMSVFIKKAGTFQFNYDKTFLPGYNRALMPVDMGRMSFYKVF